MAYGRFPHGGFFWRKCRNSMRTFSQHLRRFVLLRERGMVSAFLRVLAFCCVVFPHGAALGDPAAPAPDEVVSRFRIGPFFERRTTRAGGSFWAVRPFYSRVNDPLCGTRVTDVVWPLGTFHRDREQSWWRMILAYGSDTDVNRDDSAWKVALLPVYFQGRTRQGEDYRALFPVYGHIPHMLFMDDIDFALFPLYLDYEVNRVGREYYLWPVFSRTGDAQEVKRTGVFPVYGRTQRRTSSHLYAFWPFWTSAVYETPRNPGSSWMLFPLCGEVDREKEQQWLVLPPFFSHAKTDSAERWRLPWPFYVRLDTATSRSRSYWPVYGSSQDGDDCRRYAAWPLMEAFALTAKGRRTERRRFFPFYAGETVSEQDKDGVWRETESYTRFWPFFSRQSDAGGDRLRALELSLIRYSGGIERNWAPFWTLYERCERDGAVEHDALWGLFHCRLDGRTEPGEDAP